jgi:GNAT superfamily N-acetyltransferase
MISIRVPTQDDAPAACNVLIRSITELCVEDHHNDPDLLASWLKNKTIRNVAAWISSPNLCCVVGVDESGICGFGSASRLGEVLLCYVDPRARFLGVSSMMLEALEVQALSWGLSQLQLTATRTALRFYKRRGYVVAGDIESHLEVTMTKSIAL